jgi:diaminopimelate epimerase
VRALCDRRAGIGGDGVLRVVRTAADDEARGLPGAAGTPWFMDYRNADGSVAEMCGNGIRVYARYLVDEGLVPAGEIPVLTRDGVKTVRLGDSGDVTVEMGPARLPGSDRKVRLVGADERLDGWLPAVEVDMGNPHAVAFVDHLADAGPLVEAPEHDPVVYPEGVNVEFVVREGPQHVSMRVHERGSGETRSCGTGACAVAAATAAADGSEHPVTYRVDVPGGTLHVTVTADDRLVLTGPAEIVARGDMDWLS